MSVSQLVNYGSSAVTDGTTRFFPLVGRLTNTGTETNVETPIREAGVIGNLYVRVTANDATGPSTITLRVNLTDTALTVSYGSSETGVKEDTSNTVSVAATDEADWKVPVPTEAGTHTLTITMIGCSFTPTDTSLAVVPLFGQGQVAFATASVTRFMKAGGILAIVVAETNEKFRIRNAGTLYGLSVYTNANTRTTDTVFVSRLNGANGAQTVTFGNVETGRKENAGTTDTLAAGDDVCTAVTSGTGVGTLTFQSIGLMYKSTNGVFPMVLASDGVAQAFNVTNFFGVGGDLDLPTLTEAQAQLVPRVTFTAKEFSAFVSANTIATTATVFRLRVGGANGNQTLSYAAAETGLKSDSVNTDVITGGTTALNYSVVTPNTSGNLTLQWMAVWGEVAAAGGARPRLVDGRLVDEGLLLGGLAA